MAFGATEREHGRFDQTYLSEKNHGTSIHRDYISHCERWSHACEIGRKNRVLDLGCGPEWPLGKALKRRAGANNRAKLYVGIDLSPVHVRNKPVTEHESPSGDFILRGDFNLLEDEIPAGPFDVVACFEVLEHMGEEDGRRLLEVARDQIADDGVFLLSTPVKQGDHQARNHIKEWYRDELREAILEAELEVVEEFGTYGDLREIRKALVAREETALVEAMDRMTAFHSADYVSAAFGFVAPEACKNIMWKLRRGG